MRSTALALLTLLLMATSALADSSATMTVSAQVVARAVAAVESEPREIIVTETDVARGFVDVAAPLTVRVRTNSRNGYLLQVAQTSEVFSAVEMAFGNTRMVVREESWVARPYVAGGELVTAHVRVRLSAHATPGRHPLPLQVSASPL